MIMDQVKMEAIKKSLKFVFGLQKAIDNSLVDGKFEVSDLLFFKDTLFGAPAIYPLLPLVKDGLKDASENDIIELKAFFNKEFDLKNDKVEVIIEESLSVVISIFGLVNKIKA